MTVPPQPEHPRVEPNEDGSRVRLSGDWITPLLGELDKQVAAVHVRSGATMVLEASAVRRLDTGGARQLDKMLVTLRGQGARLRLEGLRTELAELLSFVHERYGEVGAIPEPVRHGALERLGRLVAGHLVAAVDLLAFAGETFVGFGRSLAHPRHIRGKTLLKVIQTSGADALPIVGLLSFLLGIVISYQGGTQLKLYGANIFIVELVTITFFRELSPLMAAIIIAGRTGSAFTAEIGTMKVTEEVDALTSMGIRPMDVLVLPKVFGLMVSLPLVTVWSSALGVFGGATMAKVLLDVSFFDFFTRIPRTISVSSFAVGVGKAPVFAAIVAMVGCYQGFQVSGGAESVGQRTTASVVQSIFLVIVADAAFSVMFSWLGV